MDLLTLYMLIVNAISFLFMLADKHYARKKCRRIPEAVLIGIAFIGGSVGALIGMYMVRHKTRKPLFVFGIPFFLFLHLITAIYILA